MDKKLAVLLGVLVIVFSIFVSWVLFSTQIKIFTRASGDLIPSSEKSLIFVWPLNAKISDQEKVTINVFVKNEKNQPISDKLVSVTTTLGNIENNNQKTDKTGKATFSLSSNQPGITKIEAIIDDNIKINQSLTVKFE